MPAIVQLADGRVVTLPDDQVAAALDAGGSILGTRQTPEGPRASMDAFGRKTLSDDPLARFGIDPLAEGRAAIDEGFQQSFEDEGGRAFFEGAAGALTAGLYNGSDEFAGERAAANPIASTAGQVTGLVGGAVLPFGAPGLAAKAGNLAGRSIASPVGRLALEGAVDGLTYGVMREGIGSMVYDRPFSTEAIVAETIAGGGIGAALGAAAKGAGALKGALSRQEMALQSLRTASKADSIPMGAIDPFASELPAPGAFGGEADLGSILGQQVDELPIGKSGGVEISDVPMPLDTGKARRAARDFFTDMPHMKQVDADSLAQWRDIDALEQDLLRVGSDTPELVRNDLKEKWTALQRERRAFAEEMGFTKKGQEKFGVSGKSLDARYQPGETFWRGKLSAGSLEQNAKMIDKWDNILRMADDLDSAYHGTRLEGTRNMYGPSTRGISADLLGAPGEAVPNIPMQGVKERAAQFKADYLESMAGRTKTDVDEIVTEILSRDSGKGTGVAAGSTWNGKDRRPVSRVIRDAIDNNSIRLEELLAMPRTEAMAVLKDPAVSQRLIDSLAVEARTNPEIFQFTPKSSPVFKPTSFDMSVEMRDIARRGAREQRTDAGLEGITNRPRRAYQKGGARPIASLDAATTATPAAQSGFGVIDTLRKTNLMGLMVAANFPGLVMAREVIQKYGAGITAAAEKMFSSSITRAVVAKPVQLTFSKVLAPGGKDNDRDLRAVLKASESPEAMDAAVDEAMLDVMVDSPEQRIAARERIQEQLRWMVNQVPQSLSPYAKVFSPSDIARFNTIVGVWANPMKALNMGKAISTVQIDALESLWPQTYQDWLLSVTQRASELAATGKPVPPSLGRLIPQASMSQTPLGQTILASMKQGYQPQKGDAGSAAMAGEMIEPTTAVQSMTANRIVLNR